MLLATLKAAMATGNPGGELAQKAADLHRQWLCYFWPHYDKEAHAGLAQMYVDDERFTAFTTGTAGTRPSGMLFTSTLKVRAR